MKSLRFVAVAALFAFAFDFDAAPFQNLGFDDQTVLPPDGPSTVRLVSELLPGWGLSYGGIPSTSLGFNYASSLASPNATLVSSHATGTLWDIDGPFALFFRTQTPSRPFELTQHGEIPVDAGWLSCSFEGASFGLVINGHEIVAENIGSWIPGMGSSSSQTTAIFDVSMFAGQDADLRLIQLPIQGDQTSFIDNIQFIPIPEPSSLLLLNAGIGALLCFRAMVVRHRRFRVEPVVL